jgi:O-antigen/teichoic acid export membrane protein
MNLLDSVIDRFRILLSSLVSLKQNKFIADGGIYVFFNVLNRALPFLLLPILTSYIDPIGYGIVSVVALVVAIFTPILGLCSNTVLYQRYFTLSRQDVSQFVNDSFKLIIFCTSVVMAIAFGFSSSIKNLSGLDLIWFELGIFSAGMGMIVTITTTLFLIRKQARNYGLFQFMSVLVNLGLTLMLVVSLDLSWQGRVYAITASACLAAFLAVYVNIRHEDFRLLDFNRVSQMKSIFRLGSALVPSAIGGFMILMIDRLMLTALTTLETLGIYAIGVMVAQMTDVVLSAFSRTVQPYLYENGVIKTVSKDIQTTRILYGFVVFSFFVAGSVTVSSPYIFQIMINERYHLALGIVGWLSLSSAFFNIGGLFLNLILIEEKNLITGYISGVCVIVGVVVSYLLISAHGLAGAAIANAISGLLFMLLMLFFATKYTSLPWFSRAIFRS